jgi:CelD/BcsL family acetyltransferase involved in cellulose biosynthesis
VFAVLAGEAKAAEIITYLDTPQLNFKPDHGINDYLSRNTRSAVAKARNRVLKHGHQLDVNWLSDASAIADSMDEIVELRQARDEQMRRAAPDANRELQVFRSTVEGHAAGGRTRLLTVRIDSELAAFALCFLTAGTLWVYANSVSPEFTVYSAGTIANSEVVRYAFTDPTVTALSWGAGIQRYKLSGNIDVSTSRSLTAWSSRPVELLIRAGRRIRR